MRYPKRRARLDAIESSLRDLCHQLEIMKTILIVKEPESTMAANAFEGLRKQIVAVAQEHWAHLAQLAAMDVAVNHVTEVSELRGVSKEWLDQAGVLRVDDPTHKNAAEIFETVGGGAEIVEIFQPAYLDSATGRIIKAGRLKLGYNRRIQVDTNVQADGELDDRTDGARDSVALAVAADEESVGESHSREEQV